jgi:hypothetical protein
MGAGQWIMVPGGRKPDVDEVIDAVCEEANVWRRDLTRRPAGGALESSRRLAAVRRVIVRLLREQRGMSTHEAAQAVGYARGSGPSNIHRAPSRFEARIESRARARLAHLLPDCRMPIADCPSSTEAA